MKRLLSLFVLFLSGFSAYCQIDAMADPVLPNSRIGVRGGLNFSKLDADLGGNTTARMAYHGGIFYQKYFSHKFTLQPEIQFSSEGWEDNDVDYQLQYLALAVIGKFYIVEGFNLNGGLQPAWLLSTKYESGSSSFNLDEGLSKFNISVLMGVGYDFGFGLRIGGRYLQGLNDINENLTIGTKDNELKTRTIQVYIGYAFPLPKTGRPGYGPQ